MYKIYIMKGHSLCVHLCTPARKFELHNVKLRLKEKPKIEDKTKINTHRKPGKIYIYLNSHMYLSLSHTYTLTKITLLEHI